MLGSTARAIRSMYATASSGYSPTAVSPDSITADVPSRIAFATSLASARVGSGWCTIDSSICAAVIDVADAQANETVVDQDVVAGLQHVSDHGGRHRQLAVRTELLGTDGHLLAVPKHERLRQLADPKLRPLQVGDQRDRVADV